MRVCQSEEIISRNIFKYFIFTSGHSTKKLMDSSSRQNKIAANTELPVVTRNGLGEE
jgi:hypothetical protein